MLERADFYTKNRREFINAAHILAHGICLEHHRYLVVEVIGNRNIKKSLLVDAFITALRHESGKFEVDASDRMMFETYPGQASGELVHGNIETLRGNILIGFTRNIWEQNFFFDKIQKSSPSGILFIPKKNDQSLSGEKVITDIRVHLDDLGEETDPYFHAWNIHVASERVQSCGMTQNLLRRFKDIESGRQARSSPAFAP